MKRKIFGSVGIAFLTYLAATATTARPSPPMDAIAQPNFNAPLPKADAGHRDTRPQIANKPARVVGIGTPQAGEGGPTWEERGAPRPFVHMQAGATAERNGESAPVGRGFRRHRAPFSLYTIVLDASARRGVPFHLLAGLAEDESTWREKVHGKHGEQGLFQLKASTATWCGGDVDRLDAAENADCAARYLYAQFERFGSWELAFVAFKAGPETIPERIPATSWEFAQRALLKAEAYR